MRLTNLVIRNFRALEDINCEFGPYVNVLVGPNGIGKTNVLQAIRLVKALLGARSNNEAQHTLISLGAASPHFPQRIALSALVRDKMKECTLRTTYQLSDSEISELEAALQELVRAVVQGRLGQSFQNPTALLQFLDSPPGRAAIQQVTEEFRPILARVKAERTLTFGLSINVVGTRIDGLHSLEGSLLSFLDQRLPPHETIFSYFPADRALPIGEQQIQVGAADVAQQIESHNSQPQLKYARLKNMIYNILVMSRDKRDILIGEFQNIFTGILRGRSIVDLGLNELGMISIRVQEHDTGNVVEIDNLSSGEKNLVLTFLLIATSIKNGGIVLFDEPELHLNPLVCKDFLTFMLDEYSKKREIQFIICTHSPEILSGAFSSEDCWLYHLKSPREITRVRRSAMDEYADALHRLGTSVSESLLYQGTILVEGDDDVGFLEAGFPELLKRYKITERGGRREVEKAAKEIQELERKGERVIPIFLILDYDDEAASIPSSGSVRVLQWRKRCIDNYLIDLEALSGLLKRADITNSPVASEGEVDRKLRELALSQLDAIAARLSYQDFGYRSPGLRADDLEHSNMDEIAVALYQRAKEASDSLRLVSQDEWVSHFLARARTKHTELEIEWEAKWKDLCDGKRLFRDFQKIAALRVSLPSFKALIIRAMREMQTENWRVMESLLKGLITLP